MANISQDDNESAWLTLVHSQLLAFAFENDTWENVVDFVPWYATTSSNYSILSLSRCFQLLSPAAWW